MLVEEWPVPKHFVICNALDQAAAVCEEPLFVVYTVDDEADTEDDVRFVDHVSTKRAEARTFVVPITSEQRHGPSLVGPNAHRGRDHDGPRCFHGA